MADKLEDWNGRGYGLDVANTSGACIAGDHRACRGWFYSTTVDPTVKVRCRCPHHG